MKNYEFLINTKTLKILVFEVKIKDFEVIPSDESNIKVNKTILDSPKNNIRKIVIKKTEQIIDIESLENISTFFFLFGLKQKIF